MTEDQSAETLTVKTGEPSAPSTRRTKNKRWVTATIWALSIALALCVGTVVGGGVVYGVMRVRNRLPVRAGIPSVRAYRFGPEWLPREHLPREGLMWELPTTGALIVDVTEGSPAERAGLEAGDVIVAVDEQELDGERDLAERIAEYKPGDSVTLQVWEPGSERIRGLSEVEVELGEHPERDGLAYLGVTIVPFPGGHMHMEGGRPFGEFEFHFDCEGEDCFRRRLR